MEDLCHLCEFYNQRYEGEDEETAPECRYVWDQWWHADDGDERMYGLLEDLMFTVATRVEECPGFSAKQRTCWERKAPKPYCRICDCWRGVPAAKLCPKCRKLEQKRKMKGRTNEILTRISNDSNRGDSGKHPGGLKAALHEALQDVGKEPGQRG